MIAMKRYVQPFMTKVEFIETEGNCEWKICKRGRKRVCDNFKPGESRRPYINAIGYIFVR